MKLSILEIKPNPKNPRVIKDDNYKKLLQSIKDFPEMAEVREIVVNQDKVILGGNMRFRAMQEAGWQQIPVKIVDWDEAKQKEFIIKDNLAMGEWDWDALANQFDQELLEQWGLDLPDIDKSETQEDDAPAVDTSEPAKSVLGEVYKLGRHRLVCGDATDPEVIKKLMGGGLSRSLPNRSAIQC